MDFINFKNTIIKNFEPLLNQKGYFLNEDDVDSTQLVIFDKNLPTQFRLRIFFQPEVMPRYISRLALNLERRHIDGNDYSNIRPLWLYDRLAPWLWLNADDPDWHFDRWWDFRNEDELTQVCKEIGNLIEYGINYLEDIDSIPARMMFFPHTSPQPITSTNLPFYPSTQINYEDLVPVNLPITINNKTITAENYETESFEEISMGDFEASLWLEKIILVSNEKEQSRLFWFASLNGPDGPIVQEQTSSEDESNYVLGPFETREYALSKIEAIIKAINNYDNA